MGEGFWFVFSEVGENLAVDLDVCLEKLIDELGVGRAVFTSCCIDFHRPELAEFALFLFAVGKLETPRVQQSFFRLAVFIFTGPQKALGVFKESLSAFCGAHASFNSWHRFI